MQKTGIRGGFGVRDNHFLVMSSMWSPFSDLLVLLKLLNSRGEEDEEKEEEKGLRLYTDYFFVQPGTPSMIMGGSAMLTLCFKVIVKDE